jgi:hypothetical protein
LRIKAVGGQQADDGKHALIKFVRQNPDADGVEDLWFAIPHATLPYLATVVIREIPQPNENMQNVIPAFPTHGVATGMNALEQIIVTMELAEGAAISYHIDRGEAEALMKGLQSILDNIPMEPPPGTKRN